MVNLWEADGHKSETSPPAFSVYSGMVMDLDSASERTVKENCLRVYATHGRLSIYQLQYHRAPAVASAAQRSIFPACYGNQWLVDGVEEWSLPQVRPLFSCLYNTIENPYMKARLRLHARSAVVSLHLEH